MTQSRQVYQYARIDRYGQVVVLVRGTSPSNVGEMQTVGKRETELVECAPEIAQKIQGAPASVAFDRETGDWRDRIRVRFTASAERAIADDKDELHYMVIGVPGGIDRVRLVLDRVEVWLPRDGEGQFMLRLRSATAGFSRIELVDARLYAEDESHVGRFVAKEVAAGGIENA